MRIFTLLIILIFGTCVSAQHGVLQGEMDTFAVKQDTSATSHITRVAWEETDSSQFPGYLLVLTPEGNFNEDAGADGRRKYRNLLGRWQLDSTQSILTLAVDGLMGRGLVHSRYLRGKDYFITYDILKLSNDELILKDRRTGHLRTLLATHLNRVEDQSQKRLPKGNVPQPATWQLPDFGGGGQ